MQVSPQHEEEAVAAFWEAGCLGVESVSSARSRRRPRLMLRAYFPGRAGRRTLERRIGAALSARGLLPRPAPRLRPVRERRWVETWRRSLRPMAIGRRLLVVPEGCRVSRVPRGRRPIRVRFGQAFGTGEHASTRLGLRLLETVLRPGDRVIDLGTGTGILAIAAVLLGAGRILAVDDDPVALRVARANLRDNRVATGAVTLLHADAASACGRGPFDLALVNIGATVIARILPELARALAPEGRAVLAGILVDDEATLSELARRCGLRVAARRRAPPWSALLLRRPRP
jgi:ribosomal protein L11 methyltransferase